MTPAKTTAANPFQAEPVKERPHATLSLSLLVALVVGSTIGSGIFGLLQNMAAGAGAGAILICSASVVSPSKKQGSWRAVVKTQSDDG